MAVTAISIHAPRAGSDGEALNNLYEAQNFNPRSPCGERRKAQHRCLADKGISIHAPRAGSDFTALRHLYGISISIHAPRAGSDRRRVFTIRKSGSNFNPRSPCGERRQISSLMACAFVISIHAPRAGSDFTSFRGDYTTERFQSTLPVRGATTL